jgi:hypothetical protein
MYLEYTNLMATTKRKIYFEHTQINSRRKILAGTTGGQKFTAKKYNII